MTKHRFGPWRGLPILIAIFALLLATVTAQAQTPTAFVRAGAPLRVVADHDGVNIDGYRVYKGGQPYGSDVLVGASFAAGVVTVPIDPLPAGVHTIELAAFNKFGEVRAPALVVEAGNPPAVPRNLRLVLAVTIAADGTLGVKVLELSALTGGPP